MKNLRFKSLILIIILACTTSSCVSLQQPLPGSLWGNWEFVKMGTIINGSNERLSNYHHACYKEGDRIHFSSDHKISLRWYDDRCTIHHYSIGRYQVEGNTLKIDIEDNRPKRDRPFPPIEAFRIIQINATTLKLEEIPDNNRRLRHQRTPSGPEALVYIFMKIE